MSRVSRFFLIAFALTWAIAGIGLWFDFTPTSPLYFLSAYSVSLTGLAFTHRYGGREGVRRLADRMIPWPSDARWYAIVVGAYLAMIWVALEVSALIHHVPAVMPNWWLFVANLPLAFLRDQGPVGEEVGWRGFALPELLERYSPMRATLILGLVHVAWHLPLFFIPSMPQSHVSLPLFSLAVLAIAVFDTALYLRTRANVFLAMLVHLMANAGLAVAWTSAALPVFFVIQALVAGVVVAAGGLRSRTGERQRS